jgi:hypothetical protein
VKRARLIVAVTLPLIAAGVLAAGGSPSPAAEAQRPTCFGAPATIVGSAKADVLRGTAARDVVVALGGADKLYGRGGGDLLCGGPGNDLLDGGPGRNRLHGGPGRDRCLRASRSASCELPQVPKPPPTIEGMTLEGNKVSLSDYRGRPLFVNVWAAW